MRILFAGGALEAGRDAIAHLADQGRHVLNADLPPLDHPGTDNRMTGLTDAGRACFTNVRLTTSRAKNPLRR